MQCGRHVISRDHQEYCKTGIFCVHLTFANLALNTGKSGQKLENSNYHCSIYHSRHRILTCEILILVARMSVKENVRNYNAANFLKVKTVKLTCSEINVFLQYSPTFPWHLGLPWHSLTFQRSDNPRTLMWEETRRCRWTCTYPEHWRADVRSVELIGLVAVNHVNGNSRSGEHSEIHRHITLHSTAK